MASSPLRLRQYLSKPNPILVTPTFVVPEPEPEPSSGLPKPSVRASSTSTRNQQYPTPRKIKKWKDFNWTTIQKVFQNRIREELNREAQALPSFDYIHPAFLQVYDEDCLTALLAKSHQSIVLEALQHVSPTLLEQRVEMSRGGRGELIYREKNRLLPDWAGVSNLTQDCLRPRNILPGETKLSSVWNSSVIPKCVRSNGTVIGTKINRLWPLRQILAYCVASFARYGYIITDKELVVLRIRPSLGVPPSDDLEEAVKEALQDESHVEYASIPWENEGPGTKITMNLALWILHILAANNGNINDAEYSPLLDETITHRNEQRQPTPKESSYDKDQPLSFESAYVRNSPPPSFNVLEADASSGAEEDGPVYSFSSAQFSGQDGTSQRRSKRRAGQPHPETEMRKSLALHTQRHEPMSNEVEQMAESSQNKRPRHY